MSIYILMSVYMYQCMSVHLYCISVFTLCVYYVSVCVCLYICQCLFFFTISRTCSLYHIVPSPDTQISHQRHSFRILIQTPQRQRIDMGDIDRYINQRTTKNINYTTFLLCLVYVQTTEVYRLDNRDKHNKDR